MRRTILSGLVAIALCGQVAIGDNPPDAPKSEPALAPGHSMHGEAFNEGPRQKAYLMQGMPKIHFPVTTTNAEAQAFFNQGVGQLHGFWYFEAERSFRQAAMLDPKLAMSYWGLAKANVNNEARAKQFIKKAVELKGEASRREQLWIDSLAEYYKEPAPPDADRRRALVKALENIVHEFPEDIEAKAFLAVQIWDNRHAIPISSNQAVDALIAQIFAADPMHPAHHYQIHLWNREKDARALASAARCGQSAPGIAHMWHMSGHTYTELRRYHDAAWQQEASARVDHAHMMRDRVMPDLIHNYAHNNDWLVENLAYVGRVHEAIDLAKNMVELPRRNAGTSSTSMGRKRLLDLLPQFELWDEIAALADTPYLEPTDKLVEQAKRLRVIGIAWFAKNDRAKEAEQIAALEKMLQALRTERVQAADAAEAKARKENKPADQVTKAMADALQGFNDRIKAVESAIAELKCHEALAAGDVAAFRSHVEQAADTPKQRLSQLYAKAGDTEKAIELAKQAVDAGDKQVHPLANYVDILLRVGKKEEAQAQLAKLREISATIDLDLPIMARIAPLAKELGWPDDWRTPRTTPDDVGVRPELSTLGPFRWAPSAAPPWSLPTMEPGKYLSLADYQGKPVLVVFYLGAGCPHCIEQLNAIAPLASEFEAAGISIVAISTDSPEGLKDTFSQIKADERFPFPIASDASFEIFKAYRAFDDFENKPLHGTYLLDGQHRVRWQDISYEPYKEVKFLLSEAKRLFAMDATVKAHARTAETAANAQ